MKHSVISTCAYNVQTVLFFTRDDISTTFLPIYCFGLSAAPVSSFAGLLHGALWLWLQLLQFNVANQVHGILEDTLNKPYRPIPEGRISLRNATAFRWALIPLCALFSLFYSAQALYASLSFAILTILYNELHADAGFWLVRNVLNGLGFAALEWGTTLLVGSDWKHVDSVAALGIFHTAAIFTTTMQAQDFRDVVGDQAVGRRTLPLVSDRWARISVIVALLVWSIILSEVWELDTLAATAFISVGVLVGVRFLMYRSVSDDKTSYLMYNIWLSLAHLLVGYWRYRF